MAQTPDRYLWLASESGLLRFDGVRAVRWEPPAGERLPSNHVCGILFARDGTSWLGTTKGFGSFKNGKLVDYPELDGHTFCALFEDREGRVWVATAKGRDRFRECPITKISKKEAVEFERDVHAGRPGWQRLAWPDGCLEPVEPWTNHNLPQAGRH